VLELPITTTEVVRGITKDQRRWNPHERKKREEKKLEKRKKAINISIHNKLL